MTTEAPERTDAELQAEQPEPDANVGTTPTAGEIIALLQTLSKEDRLEVIDHFEVERDDDTLDLTDFAPTRKKVKLPVRLTPEEKPHSEIHELRLLDDFGIRDQQKLLTWSKRFELLWSKQEDLSDEEADTMEHLLDQMFHRVLVKPETLTDEQFITAKTLMPDHMKSRVVTAFTVVPLLEQQEREAKRRRDLEAAEENGSDSTSKT